MHAVKNGLVALGILICLGSSPAIAQTGQRSGTAQPTSANRRSEGLLAAWIQPAEEDQGPSLFERLGIGGSSSRDPQPDWEGVPYHRPNRPSASNAAVPITDPNGAPSRRSNSSSKPRRSAEAADLTIPVPPAEDTLPRSGNQTSSRTSRRSSTASTTPSTSSSRRSAASPPATASTSSPTANPTAKPLSSTESSRRSNRRSVDPLDVYLQSASDLAVAPPVDRDSRDTTGSTLEEPRVARRPVPTAGNPTNSSRPLSSAAPSLPPSLAASRDPSTDASQASPSAGDAATAFDVPATRRGRDTSMALAGPAPASPPSDRGEAPSMMTPAPAPAPAPTNTEVASQPSDDSWQASTATPSVSIERPADTRASNTARPSASGFTAPSRVPAPHTASATSSSSATSSGLDRSAARTGSGLAAKSASSQPQLEVTAQGNPRSTTGRSPSVSTVNSQPVNVAAEIPGVRVVTSGPAEIPVRRPASYEIRVENRGSIPAPGALVRISLPRWIAIQNQQASRGDVNNGGEESERQLLWQIEGLAPGASETLTLNLSAAEARQFDVAVEWAVLPQSNLATVKVHEPKLELLIEGPEKVVYGQSQAYKVRVLNPGNGVAEDVIFTLSPNSTPQSQRIGSIPPGKEAHFEVELTARDLENLQIHGLAVGNSALKTEAIKSIEVIAADLEAVLSGPPLRYQDSSATYKLELTNLGQADCDQVTAMLRLPSGVRYEGGLQDAEVSGNVLQWRLDRLPAGRSVEYEFACTMQRTGEQKIAFECEGSAAGATRVAFTTEVEAIADLVLSIDNPAAPAPVGEEVVYEIILRNRGSKAATDVETLAQFSHDIEPVRIDGGKGQLASGQVLFDAIPRIDPGQEVRLRVIAKADKVGLHRFRTEIRSGGESLLVSEESTRYVELAGQRISRRSSETKDVK